MDVKNERTIGKEPGTGTGSDDDRIPVRVLRNDVSKVLRRVEAGERLVVTVHGRPVAELRPLSRKRRWIPVGELEEILKDARADRGLLDDLRDAVPDTTDDIIIR